jgi:hypothetical protein
MASWGQQRPHKPILRLLIGIVLAALVATILQVAPQSSAATFNGVEVSQRGTEASIKAGTDSTCVVSSRANFSGDSAKVREFTDAASQTAAANGMKVTTGSANPAPGTSSTDLILSYEFDMTAWSVAPENCSTSATLEAHRGRAAAELPSWARGMVASAAGVAVYLAVVFAVTALFTFLAPEFAIYGELVGGCVGGFASSYVANAINGVPQAANLTGSAVQCVAGALLNVTLGSVKTQMTDSLRNYLGTSGAMDAVTEGIGMSAGHAGELSSGYLSAANDFAAELA